METTEQDISEQHEYNLNGIPPEQLNEMLSEINANGGLSPEQLKTLADKGVEPELIEKWAIPDETEQQAKPDYSAFYKELGVEASEFTTSMDWAQQNLKPSEIEEFNNRLSSQNADEQIQAGKDLVTRYKRRITGAPMLGIPSRTAQNDDSTFNYQSEMLEARGLIGERKDQVREQLKDEKEYGKFMGKLARTIQKGTKLNMNYKEMQNLYDISPDPRFQRGSVNG